MSKNDNNKNKIYIAIDLKSFYASVECVERGLDAMTTNLVVADESRTAKTICLAVTPSLKRYGISGRARLFEVISKVAEVNSVRKYKARNFEGKSYNSEELDKNYKLELDYIIAPPRMASYMKISSRIYEIYLSFVSKEDIHVYSIDEVFIDATSYLKIYNCTASELATRMILAVLSETGITATAGIGTNLYLAKVAMDIVAKKIPADENGVRIAYLDEFLYRKELWSHKPLTDFWRVGKGYTKKLEEKGIYTMGDIARASLGGKSDFHSEDLLYKLFGVNAELLIDHAWGYESCEISDIKSYKPQSTSLSTGQVLKTPYKYENARIIVQEMSDLLSYDLAEKCFVTDQIVITIGYDIENITNNYMGEIKEDAYGRKVPKSSHGSKNLPKKTASTKLIVEKSLELFDEIVEKNLLIRRINIVANHVVPELETEIEEEYQLDLFSDFAEVSRKKEAEEKFYKREKEMQKAIIKLRKRYGKNAVLKGMNFQDSATTIERNGQVGGHKA